MLRLEEGLGLRVGLFLLTLASSFFKQDIDKSDSHFLTVDHDLHRRRRKPLEPFFSRKGVSAFQPMLAEYVRRLESIVESFNGTGKVIRLDHAFSALTGDIMARICFNDRKGYLDDDDFAPEWSERTFQI